MQRTRHYNGFLHRTITLKIERRIDSVNVAKKQKSVLPATTHSHVLVHVGHDDRIMVRMHFQTAIKKLLLKFYQIILQLICARNKLLSGFNKSHVALHNHRVQIKYREFYKCA